jgi:hypothetical protein
MKAIVLIAAAGIALLPVAARAQLCPLDIVAQDESGHRNIPNYRYDAHHTAGGHWQITDTNWRHFAPMVDVNLAKWPNALSAPEQLQGQVAGIMRARLGCLPWVPYNPRLRADLGSPRASAMPHNPTHKTAPHQAIIAPSPRPAWSSVQFARMTAPSSTYSLTAIAFR